MTESNVIGLIIAILLFISTVATPLLLLLMLVRQREYTKEMVELKVALIEAFKHLDKPMSDALGESRRNNRLISELLALKQAEMTGDFEIVEEPIMPATPEPPKLKTKQVAANNGSKLEPPPQSFPKI